MLATTNARSDALLAVLGVLGFVLFFLFLPRHHPDSLADYQLSEAEAIAKATDFLQQHGYRTEGQEAEAVLMRQGRLLDGIQKKVGRVDAIEVLKNGALEQVPVYYWMVEFEEVRGDDTERTYSVYLTVSGQVYRFLNRRRILTPGVNREALLALSRASEPTVEQPGPAPERVRTAPDSIFQFYFVSDSARADSATYRLDEPLIGALNGEAAQAVGTRAAIVYARHHFGTTPMGRQAGEVKEVVLDKERPQSLAWVTLQGTPLLEHVPVAKLAVDPYGRLVEMDTHFDAVDEAEAEENGVSFGFSSEGDSDLEAILHFFVYLILIGGIVIAFFRRLGAKVVDTRAVLRDAIVAGVAVMLFFLGPSVPEMMQQDMPLWGLLIAIAMIAVLGGLGGALFFFLLFGATDSMTREAWPKKLRVLSLFRMGQFYNQPVGRTLLRGLALAGVLLGIAMGIFMLWPGAGLDFGSDNSRFVHDLAFSSLLFLVGGSVVFAQFVTVLALMGVGAYVFRRKPKAVWTIGAMALAGLLLGTELQGMEPAAASWIMAGCFGTVLAFAYWRYEYLTCFIGLFFANMLWETRTGWLLADSPSALDFWIVLGVMALVAGFGLVGVRSGKSGRELPDYTPPYIEEMARQERMLRELEIARQVQLAFLPGKMPDIPGLDVAAVCYAAQEVGGDYYDFIQLPGGKLALAFGDVSGKGIQAAFFMTLSKGFVQSLGHDSYSPRQVLQRMNQLFCANVPRGTFVTMIYGVVDPQARTFTFARAGHNPLILKRSPSQVPDFLRPAGLGIGMVADERFDRTIEEVTVPIRAGDVLVFYTDGFSEALDAQGEQYGEERLAELVAEHGGGSAAQILEASVADVKTFMGTTPQHDDMTMVVVKLLTTDDGPPEPAPMQSGADTAVTRN